MRNNLSKIHYLENKILNEELNKIDNAKKNYNNYVFFNNTAIMLFVMSLIISITACIYQSKLISINNTLIILTIIAFTLSSFISLLVSVFYNNKTTNLIKNYYNS